MHGNEAEAVGECRDSEKLAEQETMSEEVNPGKAKKRKLK